jgi:uncharacterized membrane protein
MIAITGMIMVHFGPNPIPDTTLGNIYEISHGRAAILFIFLAGIGISFLHKSASRSGQVAGFAEIVIRAAILLPIGLWLQTLDHGVLVILQFYAMYFLFAAFIIALPSRIILLLAVAFAIAGPVVYEMAEQRWVEWFIDDAPAWGDSWTKITRDLLLSGYYPLITWAAPLCTGIWVGRLDLRSRNVRLLLAAAGAILAFGSSAIVRVADNSITNEYSVALSNEAHSQTHLWLIGSTGSALLVLGVVLILSDMAGRAIWPFVATGQLALTIYVGHLLLLHEFTDTLRQEFVREAVVSVVIFMFVTVIACSIWRRFFSHGPLEAVFRLPSWIMRRNR